MSVECRAHVCPQENRNKLRMVQYEESVFVELLVYSRHTRHDRLDGRVYVLASCSEGRRIPPFAKTLQYAGSHGIIARYAGSHLARAAFESRAAAVEAPGPVGQVARRALGEQLSLGRTGWCGPAAGSSARRGRRGRRRVGRPLAACVTPRYRPYRLEKLGALAECGDLLRRP